MNTAVLPVLDLQWDTQWLGAKTWLLLTCTSFIETSEHGLHTRYHPSGLKAVMTKSFRTSPFHIFSLEEVGAIVSGLCPRCSARGNKLSQGYHDTFFGRCGRYGSAKYLWDCVKMKTKRRKPWMGCLGAILPIFVSFFSPESIVMAEWRLQQALFGQKMDQRKVS